MASAFVVNEALNTPEKTLPYIERRVEISLENEIRYKSIVVISKIASRKKPGASKNYTVPELREICKSLLDAPRPSDHDKESIVKFMTNETNMRKILHNNKLLEALGVEPEPEEEKPKEKKEKGVPKPKAKPKDEDDETIVKRKRGRPRKTVKIIVTK